MVTINLFPWRTALHAMYARRFKKMILFVILLVLLISGLIHSWLNNEITYYQNKLAQLTQQIQTAKQRQMKTIKINDPIITLLVKRLMKHRYMAQQVWRELVNSPTHSVCFTDISRQQESWSFSGNARSANDLLLFLKEWHAAYLFPEIKIEQIIEKENQLIRFRYSALAE